MAKRFEEDYGELEPLRFQAALRARNGFFGPFAKPKEETAAAEGEELVEDVGKELDVEEVAWPFVHGLAGGERRV